MTEMGRLVALRLPELARGVEFVHCGCWGFACPSPRAGRRRRERRMEEELTAYSQLDIRLQGLGRSNSRRVSADTKSSFHPGCDAGPGCPGRS